MGLEERRRREKENRRNVILKAARRLFFEKGFKTVTVESIAHKAELSKGSVYLYFKSKEEIYTHILLTDIEKFHRSLSDSIHQGQSASETLRKLANIYIDFFLNDRELFRIFMAFMLNTDHMNLPEGLNSNIIKVTNKTVNIFEKIFQMGIDNGEWPSSSNMRQSRNALWGMLNGIISLHLFTGPMSIREDRLRSTVQTGLDIFIRGLRSSDDTNESDS